ncbi:hypothetical protein XPA_002142 [Xanthoria parietina]
MPRYISASKPRSDNDHDYDFGPLHMPMMKAVLRSDFLRQLYNRVAVASSVAACATSLIFVLSAPFVNDWALLKVDVYDNNHTEPQAIVSFGFLGYCIWNARTEVHNCSSLHIHPNTWAYNASEVVMQLCNDLQLKSTVWDPSWVLFLCLIYAVVGIRILSGSRIKGKHRIGWMCGIAATVTAGAVFISLLDFLPLRRSINASVGPAVAQLSTSFWAIAVASILFYLAWFCFVEVAVAEYHRNDKNRTAVKEGLRKT